MKRFTLRGPAFAALTLLGLGASTLLTGCFDKEDRDGGCNSPKGGTCTTAATVVDLSATTGCGLALQLADGTYVVPAGRTWTDFHATVGQHLLVGYTVKKNDADADDQNACPAGALVELGCISVSTTTTTTTGAN